MHVHVHLDMDMSHMDMGMGVGTVLFARWALVVRVSKMLLLTLTRGKFDRLAAMARTGRNLSNTAAHVDVSCDDDGALDVRHDSDETRRQKRAIGCS